MKTRRVVLQTLRRRHTWVFGPEESNSCCDPYGCDCDDDDDIDARGVFLRHTVEVRDWLRAGAAITQALRAQRSRDYRDDYYSFFGTVPFGWGIQAFTSPRVPVRFLRVGEIDNNPDQRVDSGNYA